MSDKKWCLESWNSENAGGRWLGFLKLFLFFNKNNFKEKYN